MATSDPPAGAASATIPSDHDQPRFARASSGLVRELSIVDTALYGILATGALYGVLYLFPIPQAVSTGINVPVMLILGFLFSLLVYYVYAQLGSAMPRAGGDYLYESRALGPSVASSCPGPARCFSGLPSQALAHTASAPSSCFRSPTRSASTACRAGC